ncbi:MAG: IclR family transcriptional regulator [Pseudomonadota bacterium]
MSEDRIATNLRTLLILEAVAMSSEPMTPTEINAQIGLPKQSIHRLCQTLLEEGFLIKDTSGKRLCPAPRTVRLAKGLLAARELEHARRNILQHLSQATGETVNYVLPDVGGMTYLDRVETDWAFRIELPIGSQVPFHCTASGKCYLASLDLKNLDRVLETMPRASRTANTITEPSALRKELYKIRAQGFALDMEELFDGMVALAVPVVSPEGQFQAAVAFHGPTQRLNEDKLLAHLPTVRMAAKRLAEIGIN